MKSKPTVDTREFSSYSQRCAYKALKRVTLNKNLIFESKIWEETSEKYGASTDRSIRDDADDRSDAVGSKSPESGSRSSESSFFREVREKLREMWNRSAGERGTKYELLRPDSGKSSMIPSKSLAESAFSARFARYEIWQSRSASVLDAMPTMSCFRRRNRDRCLPCMHKSLRREIDETVGVRSRATPPTEIDARDDSESGSSELVEFHEESLRRTLSVRRTAVPRYPEKSAGASDRATVPSHREDTAIATTIDSNRRLESRTLKSTESPSLSKSPKSLNVAQSAISLSSERSRVSSSEAHTSEDEEASSPLALDDDPSRYKTVAPCHLPTVLLPSMEPLRALKHRRPTTMESRIALMESAASAKERSDEDEDEDDDARASRGKSQPRTGRDGERENTGERKDASSRSPRVLLKVKTEERLFSPIAEFVESPRKDGLRKGYSCASIGDLSKDPTRGTLEIPRSATEDGGRIEGVILPSEGVDDSAAKEPATPSGSAEEAGRRAELPLSSVAEVARFLEGTTREDESAAIALAMLANEFSSRVTKQHDADAPTATAMRRAKLAARLTKLLADSKRYSSPDKFPSDLVFSAKQPPVCNSRLLRRILPLDSYNLVAPLLGMPPWYPKRCVQKAEIAAEVRYEDEETEDEETEEGEIPFDLVVRTSYRIDPMFS